MFRPVTRNFHDCAHGGLRPVAFFREAAGHSGGVLHDATITPRQMRRGVSSDRSSRQSGARRTPGARASQQNQQCKTVRE
jgi:hypothetical protein